MYRRLFYTIIGIMLLFGCKTEEKIIPDSKPIVIESLPVGNVSYNEVTLNAEIEYLNDEKVVEYGFVIIDVFSRQEQKIVVGTTSKIGLIQQKYKPKDSFELGKDYQYFFYLKTDIGEYKTAYMRFRVKDFWVDQQSVVNVTLGDVLRLTGNFKQIDQSYDIIIENNYMKVVLDVLRLEPQLLEIRIPDNIAKHNTELNLSVKKNNDYNVPESLIRVKVLGKVEFEIEDEQFLNDGIKIKTFGLDSFTDDFKILIGEKSVYYNSDVVDLIRVGLVGTEHKLGYYNGVDTIYSTKKLKLKSPKVSDFILDKYSVYPNEYIFVNMDDFIPYFGNWDNNLPKVTIGQENSPHVYWYDLNKFRFKIPKLLDGEYDLIFNSLIYGPLKFSKKVKVEKLKYSIVNSSPVYIGDEIIVKGNFRDEMNYAAYIDDWELYYGTAKNGELKFKFKGADFGERNVKVGFVDQGWYPVFEDNGQKINILGIRIDNISPLNAFAGDIITVKGKGLTGRFGNYYVMVGDLPATVISNTDTELKFYFPVHPRKGKLPVGIGFSHFDGIAYAKDLINNQ